MEGKDTLGDSDDDYHKHSGNESLFQTRLVNVVLDLKTYCDLGRSVIPLDDFVERPCVPYHDEALQIEEAVLSHR